MQDYININPVQERAQKKARADKRQGLAMAAVSIALVLMGGFL